jgi:hypothetical protein
MFQNNANILYSTNKKIDLKECRGSLLGWGKGAIVEGKAIYLNRQMFRVEQLFVDKH